MSSCFSRLRPLTISSTVAASVAALLVAIGCAKPSDPAPLAEAVANLKAQATTIVEAFQAETPNAAHDALHQVGGTLKSLPELAMKAGVAPAEMPKIQEGVNQLFDAFGKLDGTLHGKTDEYDLSAVSDQVTAAIATLESYVPESMRTAASHSEAGHEGDHDGSGHHGEEDHDHGEEHHDGEDHGDHGEHAEEKPAS